MDQLRTRDRLKSKCFGEFENEVCKHRQRYSLDSDIYLLPDLRQHSRLQNWVKFQNYYLKNLERLETERDKSRQKLDSTRKLASDRSASASGHAEEDVEALEHILERVKRSIERRKVLLDWIE